MYNQVLVVRSGHCSWCSRPAIATACAECGLILAVHSGNHSCLHHVQPSLSCPLRHLLSTTTFLYNKLLCCRVDINAHHWFLPCRLPSVTWTVFGCPGCINRSHQTVSTNAFITLTLAWPSSTYLTVICVAVFTEASATI